MSGFLPKTKPKWSRIRSNWIRPKQKLMLPSRVAAALQEDGWLLRNEIAWSKRNPSPESVKDRFTESWESIYFFVKNPHYWFDLDMVRQPYSEATFERAKHSVNPTKDSLYGSMRTESKRNLHLKLISGKMEGKNPGDVWELSPSIVHNPHPASYPEALCVIPLLSSCPADGVVLDPMAGSGSTLLAAEKLGRRFIGIDLNPKYCQIIIDRWESFTHKKVEKIGKIS